MMKHRPKVSPWKQRMAAKMARNKSWPEKKLWAKLRGNQLGVPIYAQKVIRGYIVDFWCPSRTLVIEVDGKQHLRASAVEWDTTRDAAMVKIGIKTIRFTAKEVFNNLPAVVAMIRKEISARMG